MTEQRTATDRDIEAQPQRQEAQPNQQPAQPKEQQRQATELDAPSGTRELRDAQSRPAIKAEGEPSRQPAAEAALFDESAGQQLRDRWQDIQTGFVDEPRGAVEKADALVAEVLKRLTDTFASEREQLEASWSRSEAREGETNTEELRLAIQRYRSFFDRLLAL